MDAKATTDEAIEQDIASAPSETPVVNGPDNVREITQSHAKPEHEHGAPQAAASTSPPMTISLLRSLWPEWNADTANTSGTDTYHAIHPTWRDASCSEAFSDKPLLYLGGNGIPEAELTSCGVTHVLSLVSSKRCQKPAAEDSDQFKRVIINIEDDYDADIRASFNPAFRFIDEAANSEGICYVHCEQGRSRSATVVIGWLMHRRARLGKCPSLLECYSAVASRRRISALNYGFFARLCDLEASLALGAYGSYAGTPSLSLLQYFMLQQVDSKLFAYPPAPSLDELIQEKHLEETSPADDVYATSRQKAIRRLLRGFCYVLKGIQSSSRACQQTWAELRVTEAAK